MRLQEGPEGRGAGLLLALDEEGHPDPLVGVRLQQCLEGGQMHHDPGLVIGRATAVEPPVLLHSGERLGLPQGCVPGRLDVMVGVEENSGPARRGRSGPDDGRSPRARLTGGVGRLVLGEDLDILQSQLAQQLRNGLRRALEWLPVQGVPCDAGDGHQLGQGLDRLGQLPVHRFGDALTQLGIQRTGGSGGDGL